MIPILAFIAGTLIGILLTAFMLGSNRKLDADELTDSRELIDTFSDGEAQALELLKEANARAEYWRAQAEYQTILRKAHASTLAG